MGRILLWRLLRGWRGAGGGRDGGGREGGGGKARVVLIGGKRRAKRRGRRSIVRCVLVVTQLVMLPADYDAGDFEDLGRRTDVDLHRSSVRSSRAIRSFGVLTLRLGSRGFGLYTRTLACRRVRI